MGDLVEGDYSAKLVLNNVGYELQVNYEHKFSLAASTSVLFQPFIVLGLLSRRTKFLELYFNYDRLNHYRAYDWELSGDENNLKIWKTFLTQHIYLEQSTTPTSNEYHIEDCATSQANINSAGSWKSNVYDFSTFNGDSPTVGVDAGDYYV